MSAKLISFDGTGDINVDRDRLISGRLLIQASSGGGKSRALRYLIEQMAGKVQILVFDPEGEFASLREKFPFLLASKGGDVDINPKTAKVLCRRLMELNASAVLDLYDLALPDRRRFVREFIEELMHLPRTLWRPLIVAIDEAHVLCPERGFGESEASDAVISLCTQGRKRGYAACLATQRIAKLRKDASAELLNKMVGLTGQDVDVARAGDELGFTKEQRQSLKRLQPGQFYVQGPAISQEVVLVHTGPVKTTHPSPGVVAPPPPPTPGAIKKMLQEMQGLTEAAEEEARDMATAQEQIKRLQAELRNAQRGGSTAKLEADLATALQQAQRCDDLLADAVSICAELKAVSTHIGDVCDQLSARMKNRPARPVIKYPKEATLVSTPQPIPTAPVAATQPRQPVPTRDSAESRNGTVSGPQQRLLDALAAFKIAGIHSPSRAHVALRAGVSPRSSGLDKNCSVLRGLGYLDYQPNKSLSLTESGLAMANVPDTPLTLNSLHDLWCSYVSGPQARMLRHLISVYPEKVSREDIAAASDQSPTSSGLDKNCSVLKGLGLVIYLPNKHLQATDLLFPENLL